MVKLNKYESTIALIILMSVLFFIIIGVYSFHILPQTYNVLSCNAGTTLFCEMDPLVQISDSSADTGTITYSTILNINYASSTQNIAFSPQTIAFPYYATDGSAITYLTINYSIGNVSNTPNGHNALTIDGVNILAYNLASDPINLIVSSSANITNSQLCNILAYILKNETSTSNIFVEFNQDNKNQLIYALTNDGLGTPTITVTSTVPGFEANNSILGYLSLVMNKDNFQTHDLAVENANDGFIDIKIQTQKIGPNNANNIAGCGDPSAIVPRKASNYFFNPSHGIYYSATTAPPATLTICTPGGTTTPCGYRFVDHTDTNATSGYQNNTVYYDSNPPGGGYDTNPTTYYDGGYSSGPSLQSKYGAHATGILSYPQLQENIFCGGYSLQTPVTGTPWLNNNINNSTAVPTEINDITPVTYSTYPRLLNQTGTVISEPIKLGFN